MQTFAPLDRTQLAQAPLDRTPLSRSSAEPEGRTDAEATDTLRSSLEVAEQRSRQAQSFAVAFALPDLPIVELPPTQGSGHDRLIMGEAAPLYFVAELDRAGLLRSVETLASLYVSGGLRLAKPEPAELTHQLMQLRRSRHERFTQTERSALFRRLFGAPGLDLAAAAANTEFDAVMASFVDDLISSSDYPLQPDPFAHVPVRTSALDLAANISSHGHGIASALSRELLELTRQAVDVLNSKAVLQAFGLHSMWQLIERLEGQAGRSAETRRHAQRAESGVVILGWLADNVDGLTQRGGRVRPTHQVVAAAIEWLEATLALWDVASANVR